MSENMEAVAPETTEDLFASFMNVCGVCKESFQSKDPKLLPCLHTFCNPCITLQTGENNTITCPTCQQECTTSELIDNHFILDLTKTPGGSGDQQNSEDSSPKCTACEENLDATSFCTDCTEWLCDQCVLAHRRVRVTKDHTIQLKEDVVRNTATGGQMSQRIMYCPVHKQEPLKLFCETCDKLTCRDCQLLEHKEHRYHFVHEASATYKQFLQTLVGKIREKRTYINNAKSLINRRYKEISDKESQVTNEIKIFAINLIQEINRRGKQLLGDLNAVCGTKKAQLGQKNSEIIGLSQKLDHCLKFAEFIIAKGNSSAILYSKKLMVNQLRRVLKTRCEVPNPNHVVDIRFNFDSQQLTSRIADFGELIVDGYQYSSARRLPYPVPASQGPANNSSQAAAQQANGVRPTHGNMSTDQKQKLMQKLMQRQGQPQQQSAQQHSAGSNQPASTAAAGSAATSNNAAQMQRLTHLPNSSSHVTSTRPAHPNQLVKTNNIYFPPSGLNNLPPEYRSPNPSSTNHMINLAQVQQRMIARQQGMINNHPSSQPSSTTTNRHVGPGRMQTVNRHIMPSGGTMQKSLWPMTLPPQTGSNNVSSSRNIQPQPQQRLSPGSSGMHMSQQMAALGSSPLPPGFGQTQISPVGRAMPGAVSPAGSDGSQPFSPPPIGPTQRAEPQTTTQSRPSSSESMHQNRTSPAVNVKLEPGTQPKELPSCSFEGVKVKQEPERILNINPNDYNFDSDPAMFLSDIKKELSMSGARPGTANFARQQSTSANENQSYNFNESITDQIMGNDTATDTTAGQNSSRNEDPNEDWCACCNNGGDLLCCDNCPKVFHKECHIPVLLQDPSGTWNCTLCRSVDELKITESDVVEIGIKRKSSDGLDPRELKACERILLELMCNRESPPFHEPVPAAVPNYYQIITHPMDFGKIKQKLSPNHPNHYQVVEDFIADCRLVFSNCATYNIQESEVGQAGISLKKFFIALLEKYLPAYVHKALEPVTTRDTHTPLSEAGSNHTNSSDGENKGRSAKRKKKNDSSVIHIS